MNDIFFISDHHIFHENILKFKDDEGNRIRNFDTITDMHEYMVSKHNSVVTESDKVYFLGDVTFKYTDEFKKLISRFHGKKRLLIGNHDKIKGTCLIDMFQKVELWRPFSEYNFICSHIPLSENSLTKMKFNVHGHVHQNSLSDHRYINVSCEVIDYTPVSIETIKEKTMKDWEYKSNNKEDSYVR